MLRRFAHYLPLTFLIPLASLAQPIGDDEGGTPLSMEEVIVTGTASPERTKYESSVAITTFEAEDLRREAPQSTADLVESVPGFWVESTAGTTQGNVFARGIIQDGGYRYVGLMEDGIPIYPVFELSFYNPDQFVRVDRTIERVEVVRGGTAPIFTSGAVGGSINFITREPSDPAEMDAELTIGDFGLYRADGYWGGPVGRDWALGVGGFYRVSDGIRDPGYRADEGGQIRTTLSRELDRGRLGLYAKYINDKSLFVVPIPLTGSPSDPDAILPGLDPGEYSLHSKDLAAAGLPISAAEVGLQDSDLEDGIHPELLTGGLELEWELRDGLNLVERFRYTDGDVRFDGIFTGPAPVTGAEYAAAHNVAPDFSVLRTGAPLDPSALVQEHGHWVIDKDFKALQNDARVTFTLRDRHDITVGLYYADFEMGDRWSLGNLLLMDVQNRPNRLLLTGVTDPAGFTRYSNNNLIADYDATLLGLYLSNEISVTDAFRVDVGIRYDDEDIDARISNGIPDVDLDGNPATPWDVASLAGSEFTDSSHGFDHTSWSIGFNYELNAAHAFFGHYTESAKLPHFDDVRNGVLQEDEVTNVELGYKNSFDNVGMFVTLFQTEFDNVPFNDILPDGTILDRRAETRTRGIEVEGVYRPIDPFGLSFAVTVQDPEYRKFTGAAVDNTGNQIRRIPETMARIVPTFYLPNGRGEVYLGVSHFDDRFSNDENTVVLPSYTKVDAGFIYDVSDSLSVQLVGDNLTDEVGLTEGNPRTDIGATGIGAIYLARPLLGRSFRASAEYRF
ncbi:MAG TPA: TonB-dependent receptor [Gammaproteobacteria bacterium]